MNPINVPFTFKSSGKVTIGQYVGMALIYYRNSEHLRTCEEIRFVTALDLIKCLKQIKLQRLLLTCAPISELPSYLSPTGYRPASQDSRINFFRVLLKTFQGHLVDSEPAFF